MFGSHASEQHLPAAAHPTSLSRRNDKSDMPNERGEEAANNFRTAQPSRAVCIDLMRCTSACASAATRATSFSSLLPAISIRGEVKSSVSAEIDFLWKSDAQLHSASPPMHSDAIRSRRSALSVHRIESVRETGRAESAANGSAPQTR